MSDELASVLGEPPPASVSALPDAVRDRLAGQVRDARARLEDETEASVRRAIAGVPFAVRGVVRKALLG